MSDTTIYVRDSKTGQLFSIRAKDQGGGIYNAGPLPLFSGHLYSAPVIKAKKWSIIKKIFRRIKQWLTQ